jgi:hypothetical protein
MAKQRGPRSEYQAPPSMRGHYPESDNVEIKMTVRWCGGDLSEARRLPKRLLTDAEINFLAPIVPNTVGEYSDEFVRILTNVCECVRSAMICACCVCESSTLIAHRTDLPYIICCHCYPAVCTVTNEKGEIFLVVLHTEDCAAVMDAIAPIIFKRGQHKQNLISQTDSKRTGMLYAAGYKINSRRTDVERYRDDDPDQAVKRAQEKQIREASFSCVREMSKLASLRSIYKKIGKDFEGLCGKELALKVTEGSVNAIYHECTASYGGFAAAPSEHSTWRDFEMMSWGEHHSDACNCRHAPPGQSKTTYIVNNGDSSSTPVSSCSTSESASESAAAAAPAVSSESAAAAAASSDSAAGAASSDSVAAAVGSDEGESAAAAAAPSSDSAAAASSESSDSAAAAAAASSDSAAGAASSESAVAAAISDTESSSSGGGNGCSCPGSSRSNGCVNGCGSSSGSSSSSGSGSATSGSATTNCVRVPRACLAEGGQFFIGNCRVRCTHGLTIMYKYEAHFISIASYAQFVMHAHTMYTCTQRNVSAAVQ